ncbi:winged helix-turn-helix transcriptional regulator [Streptomyces sp. NPDC085946]|uniref:winged helix-turn-helix transcriptional regulator n=1 Tax=Streptomyces sp. NPDC085946 TaxID=3365744 RepID=UPI0037D0A0E9
MAAVRRPGAYVCGVDAAMDVIGGKWKVLILWALSVRPCRFGELRRELPGVTEKVLASHLRELEADGIVHREEYDEVPPRVEYSLTPRGAALNRALEPLGAWGREHVLGAADAGEGTAATGAGDLPGRGSAGVRQVREDDDVALVARGT